MCVTEVQWSRSCLHVLIYRVRPPSDAVFCFFVPFFCLFGFCFLTLFFVLACFPLIYYYCWPCWSCTSINIYFKLLRVLFWKRDFKSSWSAYWPSLRPEKTISCQDMSLVWDRWIFSMLVCIMTNSTQYTTNCTNLLPTPTSDPLAKFKLAFCASSGSSILLH